MYKASTTHRYVERVLWLLAGVMSLIGIGGYYYISPWFLLLNLMVGCNLVIFALTGYCLMTIGLIKLGLKSCCTSP